MVEALARDEHWFSLSRWLFHEGRLSGEGEILAHGKPYPVRLVYPDQFPEVPAWVEPQDEAKWSGHQYGKGTLCLQLRPDNWVSGATGGDVLRSAYDLLIVENPLGEGGERAPSEHRVGELQAYDWGANPVLIGAGCAGRIRAGGAAEVIALRWMAADDVWPILVHDAEDRASTRRPPGADINSWRFEIPVFLSGAVTPTDLSDRAAIVRASGFAEEQAAVVQESAAGLVLFDGEDELGAVHLMPEGASHRRRVFVLPDDGGIRTSRPKEAATNRVAVVGAGSIGSKLAEMLVRSGIVALTLVDGDVMLPGNLERHVLDWRDVGFRKVHGLKRRLLAISPGTQVETIDVNLNWQRSAKTHAWQVGAIARCDVVVDASGDPATALFLGAVAEANGRAFVSVQVFEGGIGGLVATSIPKRDRTFVEGRASYLAWCEAQDTAPPEAGPGRYEMLAEDGAPVVADDAAVAATAAHAARIVLDILDGDPPSPESAWMLLGYRKAWLFEGHGHNIRLDVGKPSEAAAPPLDKEAAAFATALFREWLDADNSST
ncbi:ThiF family adenylyltransferase [Bradyrhizobium yuanmingense]|uniref:ThiF family adenylyltransferase n=1 Tax=Bradyrhizobium yuanmingense TaxID=108015 RepID=UPI0023B8B3F2|nr:ThiF family adenylyltransferase [Bradyrhizobium yuanmingense]MDF0498158.1 ThiF family adenylyltransferase [Bradyrhizobium yuanmingense]